MYLKKDFQKCIERLSDLFDKTSEFQDKENQNKTTKEQKLHFDFFKTRKYSKC